MKKLYIRYFNNKLSEIPTDSHIVCKESHSYETQQALIVAYNYEVFNWMNNHPDGKVEFVWLN